jgi:UrcA family protein
MSRNFFTAGLACLVLAGAGFLSASGPALAKDASANSSAHEAVTVMAPYTLRETVATPRLTDDGLPVEVISVSRPVSYADLDLARTADAIRFRHRVRMAAKDVCAELNRRFPPQAFMPTPNSQNCVGVTTRRALLAANRAIDAAAS